VKKDLKGQYLALEYVFVIGLGLMITLASVSLFGMYRQEVRDTAIGGQTSTVASQLSIHMRNIHNYDRAVVEKSIDFPESIGDTSYEIVLTEPSTIIIDVQGNSYSYPLPSLSHYNFSGSAEGGEITLYKNSNQYSIAG
jgi:hypothetical protein